MLQPEAADEVDLPERTLLVFLVFVFVFFRYQQTELGQQAAQHPGEDVQYQREREPVHGIHQGNAVLRRLQ